MLTGIFRALTLSKKGQKIFLLISSVSPHVRIAFQTSHKSIKRVQ